MQNTSLAIARAYSVQGKQSASDRNPQPLFAVRTQFRRVGGIKTPYLTNADSIRVRIAIS